MSVESAKIERRGSGPILLFANAERDRQLSAAWAEIAKAHARVSREVAENAHKRIAIRRGALDRMGIQ